MKSEKEQQTMSKSQLQKQQQQQKQKQQIMRRQISQSKGPEAMNKETETLQRKAAPSANTRCGTHRIVQREKVPLLSKTFTAINISPSTDFRQRCRDGTLRSPTPILPRPCHRSNSIDSDLNDFRPDVVFDILTRRNRTKSRERNKWNFNWKMPKSCNSSNTTTMNNNGNFSCGAASSMDMTTTKLPQLDGFCPGRTSCQLQHVSRSHFELIKYKRTLNS